MPPAVMGESSISGTSRVIDGDTLQINGRLIHLHGIDAPEADQLCSLNGRPSPCGREATEFLRKLTDGQVVSCREVNRDRHGQIVAKCKADWMDLGAEMVTTGMAVAYLRYSDDYLRNYREARGKGNGIFAGEFIEPERWRGGARHPAETVNETLPRHCLIKGNISANGERIYRLPGQPNYEVMRIDPEKGERWFCGEDEARAAGWRNPKK
jgi:endonuclease YncB( thermonuclease family)